MEAKERTAVVVAARGMERRRERAAEEVASMLSLLVQVQATWVFGFYAGGMNDGSSVWGQDISVGVIHKQRDIFLLSDVISNYDSIFHVDSLNTRDLNTLFVTPIRAWFQSSFLVGSLGA